MPEPGSRLKRVIKLNLYHLLRLLSLFVRSNLWTSTQSPGINSTAPTLRSYNRFCLRASFLAQSCVIFRESHNRAYMLAMYLSIVRDSPCARCVGNNRSIGNRGLLPNMRKYGENPITIDLITL